MQCDIYEDNPSQSTLFLHKILKKVFILLKSSSFTIFGTQEWIWIVKVEYDEFI